MGGYIDPDTGAVLSLAEFKAKLHALQRQASVRALADFQDFVARVFSLRARLKLSTASRALLHGQT